MTGRPRYKRAPTSPDTGEPPVPDDSAVPVVLPHVVMAIDAEGRMTVAVDGAAHESAAFAPPWRREDFATILDQLTARHRTPVRVEVHEADGTAFTDIITPARRRPALEPEPPQSTSVVTGLRALHAEGFVPGEDVAVAVVIAHGDAAPDGTMRGLIDTEQLDGSPTREVILLGRVSGTLTIGHPE